MTKISETLSVYKGGTYNVANKNAAIYLGNSPSLSTYPSTLDITRSDVSIFLESETNVVSTINVVGNVRLNMEPQGPYTGGALTFNLNEHATLTTSEITLGVDRYDINGAAASKVANQHTSLAGTTAEINADVVGKGNFILAAPSFLNSPTSLEFTKSVSSGQTVDLSGNEAEVSRLTLTTTNFAGKVNFDNAYGQLDLVGLTDPDSYSYKNDILRIYSGNDVLDTVRLSSEGGLTVSSSNGTVYAAPISPIPAVGTILPTHSPA